MSFLNSTVSSNIKQFLRTEYRLHLQHQADHLPLTIIQGMF